ncbi:cell division topological specificity factor MinE [Paracoccus homiensis]|uniref:Cell division topological specificity factor n=1 Tax=Paracoccus homiensis TaxID=364199 RepID=A0A1I0H6V3_9RHOB|nr:cell division topological specificity factor MinE [Paracoccus homiensis]SET79425.1 cell division topological specificity factor MinE [Paracoccus homiensis]
MFGFSFRPRKANSAQTAKERLQILLAHERGSGSSPEYLPILQKEILEVVRRHLKVADDAVDIRLERGDDLSSLEINIEVPTGGASTATQN